VHNDEEEARKEKEQSRGKGRQQKNIIQIGRRVGERGKKYNREDGGEKG
jgi:hypothetical protein